MPNGGEYLTVRMVHCLLLGLTGSSGINRGEILACPVGRSVVEVLQMLLSVSGYQMLHVVLPEHKVPSIIGSDWPNRSSRSPRCPPLLTFCAPPPQSSPRAQALDCN